MATIETNTYRSAFTTQALATMGADAEWDRLLTEYLRRETLARANERFGPYHLAHETAGRAESSLEQRFGRNWRGSPKAMLQYGPAFERMRAAEEAISRDFYDPQTEAAIALVQSPSPSLAAALFKLELIEAEELHNLEPFPADLWEIVQQDVARIAPTEARAAAHHAEPAAEER